MNDDPVAYSTYCDLQIFDASQLLEKYSTLIKWANNANILEIGCAEGTVTFKSLYPKIPSNFQSLTLVDISPKLLTSARKRIRDQRIDCLEMDIAGMIPEELQEHFDHIFSFYCLQYIDEKRIPGVMKNIFDLLKPGGRVLMSIIVTSPLYDICRNMMKKNKWPSCISTFHKTISPYHDFENPEDKLGQFLEAAGFEVLLRRFEKRTFTYESWDDFLGFAFSIIPFSKISSEVERKKFVEDFVAEAKEFSLIRIEKENNRERIHKSYSRLVAVASKP